MSIEITYFVHGTTTDNEQERATGHAPGELSELGIQQAKELGEKVDKEFDAVYCSDLRRAVESAELAFGDEYDIIEDERLRECDYGEMTQDKFNWDLTNYIDNPYPDGESYKDVEQRIRNFLESIKEKHENGKIAVVAHQAPQLAIEVITEGKTWEEAIETDWREVGEWQPGWKYEVENWTQKSKKKVEELIQNLRNRYEDFEVTDKTWKLSDEDFETELENFREGGYGGTGVWLTNEEGQVLLVRNKNDDSWGDPGGHHENDESFEEAALRETKEETNVEAEITGIQSVDRVKFKHEETGDCLFNLLVIFRGKHVSGEPGPQEEEIAEVKWWDEHPENLLYEDLKHFTIPESQT